MRKQLALRNEAGSYTALVGLGLLSMAILFSSTAFADTSPTAPLDLTQLQTTMQQEINKAANVMSGFGKTLFMDLVFIDFGLLGVRLALGGADIADWINEVVQQIMFTFFFYYLLTNASTAGSPAGLGIFNLIENGFNSIGISGAQAMGTTGLSGPQAAINGGIAIFTACTDQVGVYSIFSGLALAYIAMGLVGLVLMAFIAAFMFETWIEGYTVGLAGMFLMGFGGSRYTKDNAVGQIQFAISVGVKLMMIQIVAALGFAVVNKYIQTPPKDMGGLATMAMAIVMMFSLIRSLPAQAQAAIRGHSLASGASLAGAMKGAAVGFATMVTGAAVGGGVAASKTSAGRAVGSAAGRAAGSVKSTASRAFNAAPPAVQTAAKMAGAVAGGIGSVAAGAAKGAAKVAPGAGRLGSVLKKATGK